MSTNDQIDFSVIVPIRNLQARLREVLPTLRKMIEENPDFELLLGDDASEDSTARILEEIPTHERIKIHLAPAHLGRSRMRNTLCEMARGNWLIFLDGDCLPLGNWCESYRTASAIYPDCSLVGRVRYQNENRSGLGRFLSKFSGPSRLAETRNLSCAYFTTGNSAVPALAFHKVGGFRESFRGWGGEDYDLGLRLEKAGYSLHFCHNAEVMHPSIQINSGYFDRMHQFGQENLARLIKENPDKNNIFHINLLEQPLLRFSIQYLPIWDLLRILLKKTDYLPWPALAYRIAIFSAYAEGFLSSQTKNDNSFVKINIF